MKLCWLIILSFPAWAFHKDFVLINNRAPLEFKVVFETLKGTLKHPDDQIKLVAYCERINSGLAPLKKDQALFLLKSEVHKAVLEWKFPASKFNVSKLTLTRLQTTLSSNQALYTPLSQWLIEALLADLEPYSQQGFLEAGSPQPATNTEESRLKRLQLQKVLRYTVGWLEMADTLSATDFNALTQQLAWIVLERVQEKATLLKRFTTLAVTDTQEQTFNIPQTGLPRAAAPAQSVMPETPSAADTARELKSEASEAVEKLDVSPSEIPAEDLSGAIDQIDAGSEKPPAKDTLE